MSTVENANLSEASALLSQMTPQVLEVCLSQTRFALSVQEAARADIAKAIASDAKKEPSR